MDRFAEAYLILMEAFTAAYLAEELFEKKRSKPLLWFLLSALIALDAANGYFIGKAPLTKMAVTVLLYSLWLALSYKAPAIKCAELSVMLVVSQRCANVLVLIITYSLGDAEALSAGPYAYYAACCTAKLLMLAVVSGLRVWERKKSRRKPVSKTDWLCALIFPSALTVTALYLAGSLGQAPQFAGRALVCVLLLTAADGASILLLRHLERLHEETVLESAALRQRLKAEAEHGQLLQRSYDSQRRQTHDFNNHLAVLKDMAERDAPKEKFLEYLGQIRAEEDPASPDVNTHRFVADSILRQKCAVAKSKGIQFELMLEDLSMFPLPDDALVVVLTNLLNNAIEACEKMPIPAKRRILLKMHRKEMASFLYIENTTAEPVKIKDHRTVVTTKDDTLSHGYGLENVVAALEKNGAVYAMEYKRAEGTFCFSVKISAK